MMLQGQRALVTGAGQGNGAAIAKGLAAAGAWVMVTDKDGPAAGRTAEAIRAAGGAAESMALDVTDAAACAAAAEAAPSILVNNAGILLRGPSDGMGALDRFRATFDVNVHGMAAMSLACLPSLRAARGCVVNIASIQSFATPPNSAAYSASKGAVAQLTKALAAEWAPHGIRVNAIAPGIIATEMSAATRADPSRLGRFLEHVPMARVGEPEELVGPVVFLASAAASYVTGVVMPVDGGFLCV